MWSVVGGGGHSKCPRGSPCVPGFWKLRHPIRASTPSWPPRRISNRPQPILFTVQDVKHRNLWIVDRVRRGRAAIPSFLFVNCRKRTNSVLVYLNGIRSLLVYLRSHIVIRMCIHDMSVISAKIYDFIILNINKRITVQLRANSKSGLESKNSRCGKFEARVESLQCTVTLLFSTGQCNVRISPGHKLIARLLWKWIRNYKC